MPNSDPEHLIIYNTRVAIPCTVQSPRQTSQLAVRGSKVRSGAHQFEEELSAEDADNRYVSHTWKGIKITTNRIL